MRVWEQHTLSVISEYKVKNEQLFIEKTSTIETWKKIQENNEHTAVVVEEVCRTVTKLHLPEEAPIEAKIQMLVVGVCDTQTKMAKV